MDAKSWEPWYPPSIFAIFDRPVYARAARIAFIVASVPELVNLTRSTDGSRSHSISASRTWDSVGALNATPRPACSWIARVTSGWACPMIRLVAFSMKSR